MNGKPNRRSQLLRCIYKAEDTGIRYRKFKTAKWNDYLVY